VSDAVSNIGAHESYVIDKANGMQPPHGRFDRLLAESAVGELAPHLLSRPLAVGQEVQRRVKSAAPCV
jgi:hypothetical protein